MTEKKVYEVVMPKLGLIMAEANLLAWHRQDGDWVEAGETLFEMESEKSIIEIEAPASGFLQILVDAGKTVPVMTPVANITTDAETPVLLEHLPSPADQPNHEEEIVQQVRSSGTAPSIRATPKSRALARQRGLALEHITGTGPRGMIVSADLAKAGKPGAPKVTPLARKLAADLGQNLSSVAGSGPGGRITSADVIKAVRDSAAPDPSAAAGTKSLPLTGVRGVIAERLSTGWRERPQVTLVVEIDATELVQIRKRLNAEGDQKLSFNCFLVLAAARTLRDQPHLNVQLTDDGLVYLDDINIGIAVDTDRGLLVPVLRNPLEKDIFVLDAEINQLVQRTLDGNVLPDELTGGTFTITNLGAFGVDAFTPIINPPEAAILGAGRIAPRPFVVEGQLAVRETLMLSLSFDHRLIDGAPAARFLQRISELVENPVDLVS